MVLVFGFSFAKEEGVGVFSPPLNFAVSQLQTHPNFHSPAWGRVGSKGGHPQREGTNLGVFVVFVRTWPIITLV